jgi:hypothetical protein
MNVDIWTVAVQFLFWEYLFPIFGIDPLKCTRKEKHKKKGEMEVGNFWRSRLRDTCSQR